MKREDQVLYQNVEEWFFCEVKGGADRLRDVQIERFAEIEEACGRAVRIVELRELRP